jgi:hypothetical protein
VWPEKQDFFLPKKLIFNQFLTQKPRNTLGTLLNQFMPLKKTQEKAQNPKSKIFPSSDLFFKSFKVKKRNT